VLNVTLWIISKYFIEPVANNPRELFIVKQTESPTVDRETSDENVPVQVCAVLPVLVHTEFSKGRNKDEEHAEEQMIRDKIVMLVKREFDLTGTL